MKTRLAPILLTGLAVGIALIFVGLALLARFSEPKATHLIRSVPSPDGQTTAQIWQVVTPMHAGPDYAQVSLRARDGVTSTPVYARAFFCNDFSGYSLQWESNKRLTVWFGSCDMGASRSTADNVVLQESSKWRDIAIIYRDSGHVAHSSNWQPSY